MRELTERSDVPICGAARAIGRLAASAAAARSLIFIVFVLVRSVGPQGAERVKAIIKRV